MKKLSILTSALLLLAASSSLTSCTTKDDPSTTEVTVAEATFSIVAESNVDATFTIDVDATAEASAKNATFTGINKSNKTVKVTATVKSDAASYANATQTAVVNFSDVTTSATLSFNFVKKSTDTKTVGEAKTSGATVKTETSADVQAELTIPAGIAVSGATDTDNFSITGYEVAPEIVDVKGLKTGKELEQKVLVLDCEPDGAVFTGKKVTVKVFVGTDLAGQTITAQNGEDKVNGVVAADGYVSFELAHFSVWDVIFAPFIDKIENGQETLLNTTMQATVGSNSYTYTENVGVEATSSSPLVLSFIKKTFGDTKTTINKTGSFEVSGNAGQATINVVQNFKNITLKLGTWTITAKVWGNSVATVTVNGNSDSAGHSGGSGN